MIVAVIGGLIFGSNGYYIALAWASCSLMYFMVSIMGWEVLISIEPCFYPSPMRNFFVRRCAPYG